MAGQHSSSSSSMYSGPSVYGASCSDVGLGSGTHALCNLCSNEISLQDLVECFNILEETDPSPRGKSHSCIEVISSVVTDVYGVLRVPNALAWLIDFFFLSFLFTLSLARL